MTDLLEGLPALMSKAELAKALKITPKTLDRYHTARTGPSRIKLGGRVLFPKKDVLDWLETHRSQAVDRN